MSSELEWDMGDLKVNTITLVPKIRLGISTIMRTQAPKVQDYARSNAKWTDRTGNARQGLFARYTGDGDEDAIVLYHTVPYGIYLETRWAGRYAIIVPTIRAESERIMGLLRGFLTKLGAL